MIKRKSLITLLAVMCFATLLSAVGANMFMASANASWKDGASSFAMVEGASPRCDGENTGIRFISSMDESEYLALESKQSDTVTVNYGMIILPYDYVGTKGALTEENLFGANAVYCFNEKTACIAEGCQKTHITRVQSETMHQDSAYAGKYILNGSLIKILDNNINRPFVGLSYVEYQDTAGTTEYVFAKYKDNDITNNVRSMLYLAQVYYNEGTEQELLNTMYLSKFAETEFKYTVNYTLKDGNGRPVATDSESKYATFNSKVTAPAYAGSKFDVTDATQAEDGAQYVVYPEGRTVINVEYIITIFGRIIIPERKVTAEWTCSCSTDFSTR